MHFKSFTVELPEHSQHIVVIEGAIEMTNGVFTTHDDWSGENILSYQHRMLTDNNLKNWRWIGYDEFWKHFS